MAALRRCALLALLRRAAAGAPAEEAAAREGVVAAARRCAADVRASSGPELEACVEARVAGRKPPLFAEYLCGFSCAAPGGGTPPLRAFDLEPPDGCGSAAGASEDPQEECPSRPPPYRVEVLREAPLLALVRSFAAPDDCRALTRAAGREASMRRAAVETNNAAAAARADVRRSYTASVAHGAGGAAVAGLVDRAFGVVRRLTGYDFGLEGQEALSINLYKDPGDEFRLHCDGPCMGEPYAVGERAATSLLYCKTARKGGATMFMHGLLKIVPSPGDLLVFAYRENRSSPAGSEAVHSACPVEAGKKWVATQWYREGLGAGYTAAEAEQATRPLRRVGKPPWIS